MTKLAIESTTVQFPLVDHAVAIDWIPVSDSLALGKRRGEGGLFFYDELEAALLRLNPGVVARRRARHRATAGKPAQHH